MHELKSTLYTTMEKQYTVGSFRNIMHELKGNHGSRKLKGNFILYPRVEVPKLTGKQSKRYIQPLTIGLTTATTLSPALKFVTPGPTSTTSPATSEAVPSSDKKIF